ncbi:uncharacterized protein LOC112177478 [Rosa chinensis]|uniref:uncharacterized protein LOC112177478 n=1 Tax=Rosa chinensis TaxID=74649 RepID=UPI000D093EC7|nr:uncharacterized protein LOC112177478 [Rosa chinensis]
MLKFLKDDLDMNNDFSYTWISDKQKGLVDVVKDLFPNSDHRHCARYLYNNFKGDGHTGSELKELFWAASRSTTMNYFMKNMDIIHSKSTSAWNWLKDRPAEHWSRSHFKDIHKCDILLNNHCESFNSTFLDGRKIPILGLWEELRMNLMIRLANRRCAAPRWKCKVGPRIEKLLKKYAYLSHDYMAFESSHNRFQVKGRGVACASGVNSLHDVNLSAMTCTCRRWNLNGLPCPHEISCIYSKGYSPEDYVHEAYSQKKYMLAYEPAINPIPGVHEWDVVEKPIIPPKYTRGPGRPKLSRNKEPSELPPPAGATKLPKSYYSKVTCSKCKKKGHNTRTCGKRNGQANNTQFGVEAQNVNQVDNSDNVLNSANHVANENGMPYENVDVDTIMQEVNHQTPTQQSEPVYVQSVASSQPVHLSEPSLQSFQGQP